jgi:hypothetical protein
VVGRRGEVEVTRGRRHRVVRSAGEASGPRRGPGLVQPGPVAGLRDRERISRARARATCTCLRRAARRKPNPVCRGNLEMQDLDDGISQLSSASRASTSTRTPTSAKLDCAVSARRFSSTGSKPAADRDRQLLVRTYRGELYVQTCGWCAFVRDLCWRCMPAWPPPSLVPIPVPIAANRAMGCGMGCDGLMRCTTNRSLFGVASIVLLLVERVSDASPTT